MSRFRDGLIGAALALITMTGIHFPFADIGVPLLSLFLALSACTYLGALLAQQQSTGVALLELAVGIVVFVCAIRSSRATRFTEWDWVHDNQFITTRVSRWFPPACAVGSVI
ncbi:MAG: hypothetical protein OES09_16205 [Gammaproteobacteria bacterium]|nr:hypothetical protein [Gammaproteobacteria bacterium]